MKPDNATVTKFLEQLFPEYTVQQRKNGRNWEWSLTSKVETQSGYAVLRKQGGQFVSILAGDIAGQRSFDEDLAGLLQVTSKFKPAWINSLTHGEEYYRVQREKDEFVTGLAKEFNLDEHMSDRRFAVHGQFGHIRLSGEATMKSVGLEIELGQLGPQDVRDIVAYLQPFIKACVAGVSTE